jgi:hypothetical protein
VLAFTTLDKNFAKRKDFFLEHNPSTKKHGKRGWKFCTLSLIFKNVSNVFAHTLSEILPS